MGYPMSYSRVVHRSALTGGYDDGHTPLHKMIAGDLRRMEADQTDEAHLRWYAECAGITPDQAAAVLRAFFHGEWPLRPNDNSSAKPTE